MSLSFLFFFLSSQDALILQRIALQTKMELSSEELEDGGVPDVRGLVQELLTNLFISVYNHQVSLTLVGWLD